MRRIVEDKNTNGTELVMKAVIISPNQREVQHIPERANQWCAILGLKTNPSKTGLSRCVPPSCRQGVARRESPTRDTITWGNARLPLQPPIFHYLGHLRAHPTWEQKARDDFMWTAASDVVRYQYLPRNAFERVHLGGPARAPQQTARHRGLGQGQAQEGH